MDDDTQDKLIDLYTRYGDRCTPAQAAEPGITSADYAEFMMDMQDEKRWEREAARRPPRPATRYPPPAVCLVDSRLERRQPHRGRVSTASW